MTKPQITIHDIITGEIVTRDMITSELAQFEDDKAQAKKDAVAKTKAEQASVDKRQVILDRLGITTDELQTLLG